MAAAEQVQSWVRSSSITGPEALTNAAAVILRRNRRIIGQGVSIGLPAGNLERATQLAMLRALGTSTRRQSDSDSNSDLTIEVEFAGQIVPIEGNSDIDLALGVSPGLDGVAVRLGDRWSARFPCQMFTTGQNAAEAIRALVSDLSDDPTRGYDELSALREAGYGFYRFRTVALAQTTPGTGFIFTHRGGRVIPRQEIDTGRLVAMARGMTRHLASRLWPGVEPYGLMGTLNPVTGRVDRKFAEPVAQAIAASALIHASRSRFLEDETHTLALATATEIINELASVGEGETEPWGDPVSAAAAVLAITDLGVPEQAEPNQMYARCSARVSSAFDPAARAFSAQAPEASWGMIAHALVRLAGEGQVSNQLAESAVRSVFRNTPPQRLVGQLPWLGWAQLERLAPDEPIPSEPALLETRRLINEHRLGLATLSPSDRDLAGAIVFTKGTTPLPTWTSVRPLPFLADMLGDERLTPGTLTTAPASRELSNLLDSLRFVHQLAAGPIESRAFANERRSNWGVRMALWDQHMGIEPTALALESVCRTLEAVDHLKHRPQAQNTVNPLGENSAKNP